MKKIENIEKYIKMIESEKKEKFCLFFSLLKEYNDKYNLTSIIEERDVYIKHFLDSVVGESLFFNEAYIAEVGSGAGFPSIPLKIVRPDLSFVLFESVGKKCDFLRVIVDKLNLKKVNICNKRAEDASREEKYREKFDFSIARAVAKMNSLSEYCMPLVKKGGNFIAYKSGDITEIMEAKTAYKELGGKLKDIYFYSLPDNKGERSLAQVEKISFTPNKYPRGMGKERKNPL